MSCGVSAYFCGKAAVGGIAGYLQVDILVENCFSEAIVKGESKVGGIVGDSTRHATVRGCYNTGDVYGNDYVGGVAGTMYGTATFATWLNNSYNTGNVKGVKRVGGVVGGVEQTSYLSGCFNYGEVEGTELVGSVAGSIYFGGATSSVGACFGNGDKFDGPAVGGTDTDISKVQNISEEDFASGRIAFEFNSNLVKWGQKIGTDPYPVMNGETVYKIKDCTGSFYGYSNKSEVHCVNSFNENGFCENGCEGEYIKSLSLPFGIASKKYLRRCAKQTHRFPSFTLL